MLIKSISTIQFLKNHEDFMKILAGVAVMGSEVKRETETSISCAITGVETALSITWSGFEDSLDYSITEEQYDEEDSTQSSVLTIHSPAVISDKLFFCNVSSGDKLASEPLRFEVELSVYGKSHLLDQNI